MNIIRKNVEQVKSPGRRLKTIVMIWCLTNATAVLTKGRNPDWCGCTRQCHRHPDVFTTGKASEVCAHMLATTPQQRLRTALQPLLCQLLDSGILMCAAEICSTFESIKNWMGPYQLTPKKVTRAIRYPGLGALDWRICLCLGSRSLQCDMSMCSQDGQSPAAVRQWDVWGKTRCDIGFCKQSWLQISLDVTLHFQAVWDSWDALLSFWGFKLVTHSLVLTSMKFHNEMFKITLLF